MKSQHSSTYFVRDLNISVGPSGLQKKALHICINHKQIVVNIAAGGAGNAAAPTATGAQ